MLSACSPGLKNDLITTWPCKCVVTVPCVQPAWFCPVAYHKKSVEEKLIIFTQLFIHLCHRGWLKQNKWLYSYKQQRKSVFMLFVCTFIYISELDNLITETVRFNKFGRKMEETDVFMRFLLLNQSLVLLLAPGTSAAMLCVTLLPFPPSSSHGAGRSAAFLFLQLKPLDQGPGDERGVAACSAQPIDHRRCPSARAPCFWAPQSLVKPPR